MGRNVVLTASVNDTTFWYVDLACISIYTYASSFSLSNMASIFPSRPWYI